MRQFMLALLGTGLPRAEITESESGSDAGIPVREAKPVKEEEEKEEKAAATKEEEEEDEEKLMVESEAEDDEEPGEDELVAYLCPGVEPY